MHSFASQVGALGLPNLMIDLIIINLNPNFGLLTFKTNLLDSSKFNRAKPSKPGNDYSFSCQSEQQPANQSCSATSRFAYAQQQLEDHQQPARGEQPDRSVQAQVRAR